MAIALTAGCAPNYQVVSHYSTKANFSNFETFKVINALKRQGASENEYAGLEEIEVAIDNEMVQRGYEARTSGSDLIISYRVIIDTEIRYQQDNFNTFPGRFNQPGWGRVTQSKYNQGIMMIEMRDRVKKQVVWQGSLDLRVNKKKKRSVDVVAETVGMIFREYPFIAGESKPQPQQDALNDSR